MKNIENIEITIIKEIYFDGNEAILEQLVQKVFDEKSTMIFKYENKLFEIKEKELKAGGKGYTVMNGEEAVQLIKILTSDLYPKFSYMLSLDDYTIADVYEFIEKN